MAWIGSLDGPAEWALDQLTAFFASSGSTHRSALGLAVVVLTVLICVVLAPLYGWQARSRRRVQAQQVEVAPRLAEIRRLCRDDPRQLQQETGRLFREHGLSPWSNLSGPGLILLQIVLAYFVGKGVVDVAAHYGAGRGLLWISDVSRRPEAAGVVNPFGVVLPLLAAAASYAKARMLAAPSQPSVSQEARKMYRQGMNLLLLIPMMIFLLGLALPQALSILWLGLTLVGVAMQRRWA